VTAEKVMATAIEVLRPPRRVSVSEWAEVNRQLRNPSGYTGPWKNDKTPYLVEPMDRTLSRAVEVLVLVGCSQFGKTDMGLNVVGHAIECQPRDILAVQYSREMAIDFFGDRIENKLIRPAPSLAAMVAAGRGADKTLEKRFTSGMRVVAGWPVAGQLASRPVPVQWLDERDRMPDDIGGEGDPVELAKKRGTTYGKNALVMVTSTPSGLHPADAGTDADDVSPVLVLYYQGDQNLWNWPCPDCGEYWTPGFGFDRKPTMAHLWIPDGATPEDARDRATLICPHCGTADITEADKRGMNARGLWLPQGSTVSAAGEIKGTVPATRTASYWFCGLASPFRTIGQVAEELVQAERHYEATQDETKLKTAWNTALGFPYRPRVAGALPVEIEALDRRRENYKLGTVPDGVRYLTAAIDVQLRRWAVKIVGWNETAESWLVDRYDITHMPDGSEVDPANVPGHWDSMVAGVIRASYPMADDPGQRLGVASVAIDTGGAAGEEIDGTPTEGVALQARNFARRQYVEGVKEWRIMLVKGAASRTAAMLPNPTWEVDDRGKRRPDAVAIYVIGVHAIKNVVDNRLRKTRPGPGYIHFPAEVPAGYFEEMTAERKIKGKWIKSGRNEAWDLEVYAEAARQRLRPERVKWNNPPSWARPQAANDDKPWWSVLSNLAPGAQASAGDTPRPGRRGRRVRSGGL